MIRGHIQKKGLHLFTSLAVFPRIPCLHLSQELPRQPEFTEQYFILDGEERRKVELGYMIMIGRIASSKFTGFEWMSQFVPDHMPHPFVEFMQQKSAVHPLPILHKNEMKYADCLDIMDAYEALLVNIHREVFGKCIP